MSHIVQIQTQVRDPVAIASACERLRLSPPIHRTVQLFSRQETGLAVELPGWRYPVVCQLASGEVRYDNYNGRWGAQAELDRLLQTYAIEKTKLEARRKGHRVTEQSLQDGSVKLVIHVGA
ncbi:hypothetical protein ETAA8_43340 [Anatilimnocola aggregata]|uniref:DUF1257 domain-containing protein n=1 Tax=Anatilimnocola aggregata TaxID=2528021 RepID=A0A517YG66_9BACT|nr:DUF1257 domain-containing protein [Anatilimnocola aggregata]QDU29227.1 hypothetical protein ETAA8_43340 [Anatilimnocola aggregata]